MTMEPLACSTIVYRAITRARSYDKQTGRANSDAFLRRESDSDGISVDHNCLPAECGLELQNRRAVFSLHVGRVRDIGIDILPDEPKHANIIGVPFRDSDENIKLAEDLAEQLAEMARPVVLD